MTKCRILTIHDDSDSLAILRTPAEPITKFDTELQNIINDLIDTMKLDIICIGLAAPQIGISKQVAVVCLDRDFSKPIVLINPTNIIESGHKDIKRESCMSLPDQCGNVERRKHLGFDAMTINGEKTTFNFSDFEARAIIHEIDHLNGILYSDKVRGELSSMNFDVIRKKLVDKEK